MVIQTKAGTGNRRATENTMDTDAGSFMSLSPPMATIQQWPEPSWDGKGLLHLPGHNAGSRWASQKADFLHGLYSAPALRSFCKRICQSRYYCHHWEQAGSYGIESLALRKSIVVIPVILLGLPGSWRATQLFHKGKRAVIEESEWPNGVDQASEGCLPSFHTLEYVPQGSNWIT